MNYEIILFYNLKNKSVVTTNYDDARAFDDNMDNDTINNTIVDDNEDGDHKNKKRKNNDLDDDSIDNSNNSNKFIFGIKIISIIKAKIPRQYNLKMKNVKEQR